MTTINDKGRLKLSVKLFIDFVKVDKFYWTGEHGN